MDLSAEVWDIQNGAGGHPPSSDNPGRACPFHPIGPVLCCPSLLSPHRCLLPPGTPSEPLFLAV